MEKTGLSDRQRRQIEEMRRKSCLHTDIPYCKGRDMKQKEELPKEGGSFSVRLLVALLLFACFLHFHFSGMSYQGFDSETAIEAVSRDADLQKLTDSVRISR